MSERGVHTNGAGGADDRAPKWLLGLAGVTVVLLAAVLLFVVLPAAQTPDEPPQPIADDAAATTVPTTAVPVDDSPPTPPEGRVAYVTEDGRVLVGEGAEAPVQVGEGAAIGAAGLGAVAIAPTADLVAYSRNDGALVVVPVAGGEPLVLATDVALDAIGNGPTLAWDPTGSQIAYLAVGTAEMAEPRPETPPPLSSPEGVYRVPLPEGVLGNVVKIVDRTGAPVNRIGDPSTRSIVGVVSSLADDLMLIESVSPDTLKPYTMSLGLSGSSDLRPTVLSADDPAFSPDGAFVIAVGPDKSGSELVRITTDTLARAVLVSEDRICNPSVSPDATRIVYAAGEECSRLMVISAEGGTAVDVTPTARPGTATFEYGTLGWTSDGHYVTFADCRATDGPVRCGGQVSFLDLDRRREVPGPVATTVVPVGRPLVHDLQVDIVMAGPIEYESSFAIDAEAVGELTTLSEDVSRVTAELVDGDRTLTIDLQVQEGAKFASGQMRLVDPTAGIDRTFLVLATPTVIGLRVVSLAGIWISTDELPVVSGEFRLAVRRR